MAVPSDGEERGDAGVQEQEPVPPAEINFEHVKFRTGVQGTVLANHVDNVLGGGEGQLPEDVLVEMGHDPGIDPGAGCSR